MPCAVKNCKIKSNINPRTGLCTSCDQTFSGISRRVQRQDKQSEARDQQLAAHRAGDGDEDPLGTQHSPGHSSADQAPAGGSSAAATASSSLIDVESLQSSYSQMLSDGSQPKIFTDMFGMMLQVVSKQTETEQVKDEVRENTNRIKELEAKIGGPKCISEKLGLAVRNLPFSQNGQTELDNVRSALLEIRAPGVDTVRDVIKAERVGSSDTYLGTVKIEMRDDNSRALIMKNKKNLAYHQNPVMRNLIVKNLKSENQMALENFARDLLKLVPGGNEVFMAANGHLRQRGQHGAPQHHVAPHQVHHTRQVHPQQPAHARLAQAPRPNAPAQFPQSLAPPQPRAAAQHLPRPQQINLNFPPQSSPQIQSHSHPSYSQAAMAPPFIPVYANHYANPMPSTSNQANLNPLDVFDPLTQIIMPPIAPLQYRLQERVQSPGTGSQVQSQVQDGQQETQEGAVDRAADRVAAQVIQDNQ